MYRTPAFELGKKLLLRLHQDGPSVLNVADATRNHVLQADPDTFFITDQSCGSPDIRRALCPSSSPFNPDELCILDFQERRPHSESAVGSADRGEKP